MPTELGTTLIRGYQLIDPELCKPQVTRRQGLRGSPAATASAAADGCCCRRPAAGGRLAALIPCAPPAPRPAAQVRAHVEQQIGLVAKGQADKGAVVAHTLEQFRAKFAFFVAKIARMDGLFEASFSPLSATGKPLSKCGKCLRYMKYISARPVRLYCNTCEEVGGAARGRRAPLGRRCCCCALRSVPWQGRVPRGNEC